MIELSDSGVAETLPRGCTVNDASFENYAGGDGKNGSMAEPADDAHEYDERDSEKWDVGEGRRAFDHGGSDDTLGGDELATSFTDNVGSSMSDFDFDLNFDFDTQAMPPAASDDGYGWGAPAGRDPHMWGAITISGAPDFLTGESLIGARLTFECCWRGDDAYVDAYEFEIDIEGELYGPTLDHIRNHPECVRVAEQWSYPPADIVVRALDAVRRRDLKNLCAV